jgi:hypothetical protein
MQFGVLDDKIRRWKPLVGGKNPRGNRTCASGMDVMENQATSTESARTSTESATVLFAAVGPDRNDVEFAVYPDGSYAVICGGQTVGHWPAEAEKLPQALQTFRRLLRSSHPRNSAGEPVRVEPQTDA